MRRSSTIVCLSLMFIMLSLSAVATCGCRAIQSQSGMVSEPEKAVMGFYNAIMDMDVIAYLNHTDLHLYRMASEGEYHPEPYEVGIDYDSYRLEKLTTRLVREEGDLAEVEVTGGLFEGILPDGSSSGVLDFSIYPRSVRLLKVEGVWLVQNHELMKLPWLLPEDL